MLIIKRLRNASASWEELSSYLEEMSDSEGYDFRISKRTFDRDCEDIASAFGIDIVYDHAKRAYTISEDDSPEIGKRIMEAFEIFDALQMRERIAEFVQLESRRTTGTEYLRPLINAIRDQHEVAFQYGKFDDANHSKRMVQPYGIKEFRNWWFLLAKDEKDGKLKNFAFDRMSNLEISKKKFQKDPNFDIQEYYKHSFGVTVLQDREPPEVILSITGEEINYVKAMPMHASQEIIEEKKGKLLIKLRVHITWEFVAELRSKGPYIKIISPADLQKRLFKFTYLDQF